MADAAVTQWDAIASALTPIIGGNGVAALYHRSLYLNAKTHPWLAHQRNADAFAMDLAALRSLLIDRDAADVAAGNAALIQTFNELLASLVGASLAERLLGPVWAQSQGATPEQNHPS
ncbi:MAG: hypothetical protein H0X13_04995 [Ramlibacter sp.]|nr:hypothetical protein [Ramlibacter sp.]